MPLVRPLILFTHEFAPFRGGAATYVQEIAAAASAQGRPVEVWTADYRGRSSTVPGGKPRRREPPRMFHVERLPSSGRLTPLGLAGLMRGLLPLLPGGKKRGARVVLLSVGAQMAWMPLWAAGLLPARGVTCFFHGSELLRFERQKPWRWLARRFFARVNGFAVASRYVEALAKESGLLPPGAEICVAPCAVPSTLADASGAVRANGEGAVEQPAAERSPVQHGKAAAAPAGGENPWRVLTVARLHPRKGQHELVESLGRLPAALRERVVYQMAGTGTLDYRRRIENACRTHDVRYEFLGAVSDAELGPIYAGCTLYAQASRTLPRSVEGFGISFLEASLFGKPVAAYCSGGIAEAVLDGETGLLVPEGDGEALTAAIERLLLDPALRARLGAGGRQYAASFDWRRSAQTLCDFALRG